MRSQFIVCLLIGIAMLAGDVSAGLLWEDDFEDKNLEERWTRGGGADVPSGWEIVLDNTTKSNVVEIFPNAEQLDGRGDSSFALGKEVFTDFAWVMDIQVLSKPFVFNIGLIFRTTNNRDNFYELELLPTGFTRSPNTINWIRRHGGWDKTEKMASADIPIPFTADQWYQIVLVAEGNSFTFYIKEGLVQGGLVLVDRWTDEDNLNVDGILGFHMASFIHYLIDNVKVFESAMDAFTYLAVEPRDKLPLIWGELKLKQ